MWLLIVLTVFIALVCLYSFVLRPRLLTGTNDFSVWVQHVDAWAFTLWRNSRTLLVARLYVVIPIILELHDYIAMTFPNLDLTPLWNKLLYGVPEEMRSLVITMILVVTGFVFEMLRRYTATPVPVAPLVMEPTIVETIPPPKTEG